MKAVPVNVSIDLVVSSLRAEMRCECTSWLQRPSLDETNILHKEGTILP